MEENTRGRADSRLVQIGLNDLIGINFRGDVNDRISLVHIFADFPRGGGASELTDGWGCAILALEVVPKNLIFA